MMARKGRTVRNMADKGKDSHLEMRGRIVEVGIPLWNRDGLKRHIQFKAGKMYVMDNMVYPDPRKGLVFIDQDPDHVMHFCWKEREGLGTKETDLTPDPYDSSFVRVTKCTTGRVYLLKIKSTKQNYFFWIQEPSEEKDSEICNRVNYLLNFPPLRLRFPQIACNFEVPQGPCHANNDCNNDVNGNDTSADTEPVPSPNQYDVDEIRRMQEELLLISTMTNPARDNSNNPDPGTPDMIRPIPDNTELMRRLEDGEKDTSRSPEESIYSETAKREFDKAARLGTLIPTLKNMGFSERIVDAAVEGDWQIFINNLSREDTDPDCEGLRTDTDWFQKLKSILLLQDHPVYRTPDVLKADINKIVGALAEVNIEYEGERARNGNNVQKLPVAQDTGVTTVACGSGQGNQVRGSLGEGQRIGSHGRENENSAGGMPSGNIEGLRGVITEKCTEREGLTDTQARHLAADVSPTDHGNSRRGLEQEQDKPDDHLNQSMNQTPECTTVSACGTQTDGPVYQSKTSLCNRVSRKLLKKSVTSLPESKELPGCSYSSNSTERRIEDDGKQLTASLLTFEDDLDLDQPGCSSWNYNATGRLSSKKDGSSNTDDHTGLLNFPRKSTTTQGSVDTADITSIGNASLYSCTDETVTVETMLRLSANNDARPDDRRERTTVLPIHMDDKSRSTSHHDEPANGNQSEQISERTPGTTNTDPNYTGSSCDDVIFVRGPYYEPADICKASKNSDRQQEENRLAMGSGVGKRKREWGVQPASKKFRTSSLDCDPPPPFRAPDPSQQRSEDGERRSTRSRNTDLLGKANKETGNPSRKRINNFQPPGQEEPPAKKARTSDGSRSDSTKIRTKTQKSGGSRTPTPTQSSSSDTSSIQSTPPGALNPSDSREPSRREEKSRYNLRRRSTEQDTRPEVDSEQQTEPVRIREIRRTLPETRLRAISRAPRDGNVTNRDRSQNTDPVLIENTSKPKDRKTSGSNKKPGAQ